MGQPNRLFRNEADARTPGRRTFVDVSEGSGIDGAQGMVRSGTGVVVADYDNDGDSDVFITGYRKTSHTHGLLYRNDGGGVFTDVSKSSGVRAEGYIAESASWTDYDLDGFVDLMICSWGLGSISNFRLLHNEGDGTFSDASDLVPEIPGFIRTVFAHLWMDYDQDGYADGFFPSDHGPAVVLKNVPAEDGGRKFINVADELGFGGFSAAFPMGIAAGDHDGDGDLDLGISTIYAGAYFENRGEVLEEIFPFVGIFGWGVDWVDVDNDADLDFYMAGSFVPGTGAGGNLDVLFRNLGGGVFDDLSPTLNTLVLASKNSIQLDFNNDGRMDLITCNTGTPGHSVSIYENVSTTDNHWIKLRLRGGGKSNVDAIGAVVRLSAGGTTQVREVISGSSTSATEDLRLHFGLGQAHAVDRIQVVWPRKGTLATRTTVFRGPIGSNRIVTLCEPGLAHNPQLFGNECLRGLSGKRKAR